MVDELSNNDPLHCVQKVRSEGLSDRHLIDAKGLTNKGLSSVEVRGFEPLTPCMPSAREPFTRVQIGPNRLRLLGFQFISVRQNSLQFKSTAEVLLKCRQICDTCRLCKGSRHNSHRSERTAEVLLKCRQICDTCRLCKGSSGHLLFTQSSC